MNETMNQATSSNRDAPQHGFTLIETMVALVVLSVGMMGIAAMYGEGLTAGRGALLRGQAVDLAADMADRIRSNRLAGAAYAGAAANNHCDPEHPPVANCTPVQMAAHDLYVWNQQIDQTLPGGAGNVAYDNSTTPATYTISLSWTETGQGTTDAAGDTMTYQLAVQVPTF